MRPDGERVDIGRLPRNAVRTDDGGWEATGRAADGTEFIVYYNPYGLPEFPARGAFLLPPEVVKKKPRLRTEYVRSRLKKLANTKPGKEELEDMGFTPEQIETMKTKVNLEDLRIQIHEDYRVGRMLIVDEHIHRLAHQGGRIKW